jgi:hypothetical protein
MTRGVLLEELLKLSPVELKQLLSDLARRLEARKDLELAREVIERYRPALEELASR